jgi:hypothetical protein
MSDLQKELLQIALLPLLQFLLQLVPLFLYLLRGLLGIIYFLHAHPHSASGPGNHAGQRDTGGPKSMANLLFMLDTARLLS